MLIAHITFKLAPENRSPALEALIAEAEGVCAMAGCQTFIPFLHPTDHTCVGIIHEWDTRESFSAYIASPAFAALGNALRPLMIGPPVSKRFDATLIEGVT
ncbi:putative quinol monooxygenase [Litoreibacter roseus]|uniref:ABM domain-containing protein n=1 Tax=Litoreibacter roseus TaxID=2601869 RepID=A0A6N6JD71_9RHOB|nr:antibiotic biosynthesis monooxygenase [Litoreibacter roseus]GFE64064.1 hypothetical protein KIN_11380 [Litoreibacter roseus]